VTIPVIAPEVIAGRLRRRILRPPEVNAHLLCLGDSGSGKDFFTRHVVLGLAVPLARAIVLDVTRHQTAPGVLGDATWAGWGTDCGPGGELPELPAHLSAGRYRVLVPAGEHAGHVVRGVLEMVDTVGEVVLVISDAGRVTEPSNRGGLGLGGPVARLMHEGRKRSITVIACSTSAAWAESGVKDQARTKLLGITSSGEQRREFAKLAGLEGDYAYAREALARLAPRQFLYCDWADGRPALAITSAGAAGQAAA
jgi:hypothetical protein